MQDILIPSTSNEYLSIIRICIEKQNAHISIKKSPLLIEKLSVMHSRYKPAREMTTLIHTLAETFFLNKSPIYGTIIIYKAVI